jgi:hypothetical protein
MSKLRKHPDKPEHKKQMARTVKQRMTVLISFLMVILIILIFGIGETWWSTWMVEHRKQIVGVVLFFVVFLVVLSPVIVEATSNTRTLSGPGKTPQGPWPE